MLIDSMDKHSHENGFGIFMRVQICFVYWPEWFRLKPIEVAFRWLFNIVCVLFFVISSNCLWHRWRWFDGLWLKSRIYVSLRESLFHYVYFKWNNPFSRNGFEKHTPLSVSAIHMIVGFSKQINTRASNHFEKATFVYLHWLI